MVEGLKEERKEEKIGKKWCLKEGTETSEEKKKGEKKMKTPLNEWRNCTRKKMWGL